VPFATDFIQSRLFADEPLSELNEGSRLVLCVIADMRRPYSDNSTEQKDCAGSKYVNHRKKLRAWGGVLV
jgi:hypothetical protein